MYPEVKKLDPLIKTCHHRLEQLKFCYETRNKFGDELKFELQNVLTNLANKINKIDTSQLSLDEKNKLDNVFNLSMSLYQDLTEKPKIEYSAIQVAYQLSSILESLKNK